MTAAVLVFTCTNATSAGSSHGAGINSITLTGTTSAGSTFTVTYNANGATSGDVPTDVNKYNAGSTVTVLDNTGSLVKEHYTFDGWNTTADGTGTDYTAGSKFNINANTTLFAQWKLNANTVTLPAADTFGTYTMSAKNPVAYGTEVTLTYTPATGYEKYSATWSLNGEEIAANTFTMPDADVTVTVRVEKKTTTELSIDFEKKESEYTDWTFSNIEVQQTNSGVTPHGGSYIGSTGGKVSAFVQTKEKVNPVSLTCYVSKQSNNTTESNWYIQFSSDGETWTNAASRSATDMNKGEWKEFKADLSNYTDVYVRVYYSGSTAVRNIDDLTLTVTGTPKPMITVDSYFVNVAANGGEGTIGVEYKNITSVAADVTFVAADGTTPATYEWVTASINSDNNLEYLVEENNGTEARTAYLKVWAYDDEMNEVYSNLITVTQAKPVATTSYTLATTITSGKHYIITNGSTVAMGYQKDNNRAAVDITISENTTDVTSDAGVHEFVVYGPDAEGYYTIYDEEDKGYLYVASSGTSNLLKTQETLDKKGKWSISIDNNGVATIKGEKSGQSRNWMRFNTNLFACYASGQDDIYLYERVGEAIPTEAVTITDAKYATYCSENALDFSNSGVTAYIAKVSADNKVTFETVTKVPAYTGVLLKADAAGEFTAEATTTADDVTSNAFIGVTEQTTVTETGIFVLMKSDMGVGFHKTTKAFTLGAHTAYLPALADGARSFIALGEATAIDGIAAETLKADGAVYNLQGQRVEKAQKGLYIVGGKKMILK